MLRLNVSGALLFHLDSGTFFSFPHSSSIFNALALNPDDQFNNLLKDSSLRTSREMVEPITAISIVAQISLKIKTWLDETDEKNSTLREIGSTIERLQNILSILTIGANRNVVLDQALSKLVEVLQKTEEHLFIWGRSTSTGLTREKSAVTTDGTNNIDGIECTVYEGKDTGRTSTGRKFSLRSAIGVLRPSCVIAELEKDQKRINDQILQLLLALTVMSFANNATTQSHNAPQEAGRPNALKWIRNPEVAEFWGKYIGAERMSVENKELEDALGRWFPKELDGNAMSTILCRLDEYKIGCVNVTTLDDFAGTKSLQMKIAQYMHSSAKNIIRRSARLTTSQNLGTEWNEDDISILPAQLSLSETRLTTPLLIWVDDNPHHNTKHVDYARSLGIGVIELFSTAEAKFWIDENLEFLRSNNSGCKIRFITDNVRRERGQDRRPCLNSHGGEALLRFVRGRRLSDTPVLVFCSKSIRYTAYVKEFELAGSTTEKAVVWGYIKGLYEGDEDTDRWARYGYKS